MLIGWRRSLKKVGCGTRVSLKEVQKGIFSCEWHEKWRHG